MSTRSQIQDRCRTRVLRLPRLPSWSVEMKGNCPTDFRRTSHGLT